MRLTTVPLADCVALPPVQSAWHELQAVDPVVEFGRDSPRDDVVPGRDLAGVWAPSAVRGKSIRDQFPLWAVSIFKPPLLPEMPDITKNLHPYRIRVQVSEDEKYNL